MTPDGFDRVRAVIYFHAITTRRLTGSARSHISIFEQICGTPFLEQAVFVTTMWNKIDNKGMSEHNALYQGLFRKYQYLGGTKFMKFNSDSTVGEGSAMAVLDAVRIATGRSSPAKLQFAREIQASGRNPSGVRKTSAGKVLEKDLNRGFCVIL
jgi:hypothetical protein